MKTYGLVGYPIHHSLSPALFQEEIVKKRGFQAGYELFSLLKMEELPQLVGSRPDLCGFNVTAPYKETILPLLTHIDSVAATIGAVNTVVIDRTHATPRLLGYNTDYCGFAESLLAVCPKLPTAALILGTGGAAKAACYALSMLHITPHLVSRTDGKAHFSYAQLTPEVLAAHKLIINATPVGMGDYQTMTPPIPYEHLQNQHLLFDMIYEPAETIFLQKGREMGAHTCNGRAMLYHQAEASWRLWQLL